MAMPPRALPFALAVVSGLITSGILYVTLQEGAQAPAAATFPMVVAATTIDDSRPLIAGDIQVVKVSQRLTGSFAGGSEVVGRLPLVGIPKGQPILTSHLAPQGSQSALWHRIPPGMRALTVAVDEVVGVGGFLKPNQRVDIIGVRRAEQGWRSRTIAQDVAILALAQDDKARQEAGSARLVTSATLLVTPRQAESVSLATEEGRIRLVLRAPNDHALMKAPSLPKAPPRELPAKTAPTVVYRQAPSLPQPLPAGIEVIRGSQTEVVRP